MRLINNRIVLFVLMAALLLAMTNCGTLFNQEELNPADLPLKMSVGTSGKYFTSTPIARTGDPSVDFGVAYNTNDTFLTDVYDAKGGGLVSGSEYMPYDIQSVYIAYDTNFLYIGHSTTNEIVFGMDALMVVLDNGLTNGSGSNGVTNIGPEGYAAARLSGDLGLDNLGIGVAPGKGKISLALKHWRKQAQVSTAIWSFVQSPGGVIETVTPQCFYYSDGLSATGVTELAIPWKAIFGASYVVPGVAITPPVDKIKIAIIVDPTLDLAGGRDFFPNHAQSFVDDMNIDNWLEIDIRD